MIQRRPATQSTQRPLQSARIAGAEMFFETTQRESDMRTPSPRQKTKHQFSSASGKHAFDRKTIDASENCRSARPARPTPRCKLPREGPQMDSPDPDHAEPAKAESRAAPNRNVL